MWVIVVITSQFFWGVIVGLILSVVGSYSLARFSSRQQQEERKSILKNFCADTVTNIRQIIDDMDQTLNKVAIDPSRLPHALRVYPDTLSEIA